MKNGRIILKATLSNITPVGIGGGKDEHSDRDVVTTLYPVDDRCEILPPGRISEAKSFRKLPFIPATSFMGAIFRCFDIKKYPEIIQYWGRSEENASYIDCSDILISHLPDFFNKGKNPTEIRDGIRFDPAKGMVAPGAKFDYELLAPGAKFNLTIIFRIEPIEFDKGKKKTNYDYAIKIASGITQIIENGFEIGSKTRVGFGKMNGVVNLFELNFENPDHFKQWIQNDLDKNPIKKSTETFLLPNEESFEIEAKFKIKNSLMIRSYSKDPRSPDSAHLKSGGKNILSGSSIKGVLRGRAERILNTIQEDEKATKTILDGLFGNVEKKIDGVTVKPNGYTIPSRVFVDEIPIEEVKEEIQTRIQIDRFTGGTIDGALIEEVPVFPVKDDKAVQLKNLRIGVYHAQPLDKGLILLLLKDLWTSDLAIGGEKSIGRGVLIGENATVTDGKDIYKLPGDFKDAEKIKKLQTFVDILIAQKDLTFYHKRINRFKNKRK